MHLLKEKMSVIIGRCHCEKEIAFKNVKIWIKTKIKWFKGMNVTLLMNRKIYLCNT